MLFPKCRYLKRNSHTIRLDVDVIFFYIRQWQVSRWRQNDGSRMRNLSLHNLVIYQRLLFRFFLAKPLITIKAALATINSSEHSIIFFRWIMYWRQKNAANSFALTNKQPGNRVYSLPRRMPNNVQIYLHKRTHRFRMPCSRSRSDVNPALR